MFFIKNKETAIIQLMSLPSQFVMHLSIYNGIRLLKEMRTWKLEVNLFISWEIEISDTAIDMLEFSLTNFILNDEMNFPTYNIQHVVTCCWNKFSFDTFWNWNYSSPTLTLTQCLRVFPSVCAFLNYLMTIFSQ